MKYTDFNFKRDGFVGHLAEPENSNGKAVIVIMGGEKSLIPGIKIAERFADFGLIGLSVSLFGAEGLPDGIDRIPLEMFIPAIEYLKNKKGAKSISLYGMSMGSVFAALIGQHIGGIDNIVMVSPSHVPFEGTLADKKTMTGKSMATWQGKDIPFVKEDFSGGGMNKYIYSKEADRKVTKMWQAYYDAYQNKELEEKAALHLEKTGARILMIAGTGDEMWYSDYSVRYLKQRLDSANYEKEYKTVIFPNVSHLTGIVPNKEREKMLYFLLPLIGIFYKSLGKYRKECMEAFAQSEKEIIDFISKGR